MYHLRPNLVWTDTEHNTKIYASDDCTKSLKKQIPSVSIAAGYDFGCTWNYGLPELTLAEKALIGLVRVHADILKLSAPFNLNDDTRHSALKGHVFATRHDGPIQAATVLPRLNANDMVFVYFLGKKNVWNKIRKEWRKYRVFEDTLKVRPDLVMLWLRVLKAVNRFYYEIEILELTEAEKVTLENIPKTILNEAHVSENEFTMRLDQRGSASTGQPVADHNLADRPDGEDDHIIDDRNDRGIDSVFINDFDEVFDAPNMDTGKRYLCAVDNLIDQMDELHNPAHIIKIQKKKRK